jgi:hypothetical protein
VLCNKLKKARKIYFNNIGLRNAFIKILFKLEAELPEVISAPLAS